jgi:hypothetical protein
MNDWLLLVTSLPTENATVRMRAWRTLKASGAAVLRDGVYLMPDLGNCRGTLEAIATDVVAGAGTALVLPTQEPPGAQFRTLFQRDAEYAALQAELRAIRDALTPHNAAESLKPIRKLRKSLTNAVAIDFFPGEAARLCEAAMQELEQAAARALSPNEPVPGAGAIARCSLAQYQGRTWATRRRPWVDRLASAWLIRRFIDASANILWLDTPQDCPADAIGFDFDGAQFSHVDGMVSFEVLLASFGLESKALLRLGALVRFLDVGGVQTPEALGIESVMAGMRDTMADDDILLAAASAVFNGLLHSFTLESQ